MIINYCVFVFISYILAYLFWSIFGKKAKTRNQYRNREVLQAEEFRI